MSDTNTPVPVEPVFDDGAMPLPDLVAEKVNAEETRKLVRKMVYPYLIGLSIAVAMVVVVFFGAMSDKIDRSEFSTTGRQIGDLYGELTKLRQTVDSLSARSETIAPEVQQKVIDLSNRMRAMESQQTTSQSDLGVRPDAMAIAREADKLLEKNPALQLEEVMKADAKPPVAATTPIEPEKDKKTKDGKDKAAAKAEDKTVPHAPEGNTAAAAQLSLLQNSLNELRQRLVSGESFADDLATVMTLAAKTQVNAPTGVQDQLQPHADKGITSLSELAAALPDVLREAAATADDSASIDTPAAGRLGSALTEAVNGIVEVKQKKTADSAVMIRINAFEQALRKNTPRAARAALSDVPEAVRTTPKATPLLATFEETCKAIEVVDIWRNNVSVALRNAVTQ